MEARVAEQRLTVERDAVINLIAAMKADLDSATIARADSNVDDEHDPEGSTGAFERAQAAVLLAHAENQLGEITAALDRLTGQRYGGCEGCDRPIAEARLEALPATRYCITCAARQT